MVNLHRARPNMAMKLSSTLDGGMIERVEGSSPLRRPDAARGRALGTYGQIC